MLTTEQLGHLRHWDNLSRQQTNDWSLMQGKGVSQDDFGGYRFQLAYMIYGLALTHRHRLPAAPGLFQPTIQRLITKLLEPEVWLYWRDVSRGGSVFNAHLGELGEEWDPVVRDNIMYSAYVQSTALLHDYLFTDDRFARPESLTFRHWSFFWGGGEKRFAYDRDSLTEHLYWQMVANGYLGVACEPNCIFQICNQPAILGFRLHDLLTGGHRAEEVVAGYEQAWADFGRLDAGGHYNTMMLADSRRVRPNEVPSPWVDAWCGALMNMWNSDFVHQHYPRQVSDFLIPGPDGTLSVPSAPAREVMGQRVVADTCDFGWVAAWAAEMGDKATVDGLLGHADRFFSPVWRDGGLYYPRNDTLTDEDGNRTEIEPMSGNVLLGYARLNVPDGLHGLYQNPWPDGHFTEPAIVAVDRNVDVSRAEVIDGVLHTRVRINPAAPGGGTVTFGRLPERWRLNGSAVSTPDFVVPPGPAHDIIVEPLS
ncbi:linalool dehydratase/isomerase domain-containing protein [Amycolatopsis thermoflava]|uniref:linalool dehydratase/isomerase domain-containing protein n=1 Tax=Amycolatopsis thermoflava TaxID=84480 RepID=UPI0038183CDA